MAHAHRNPSRPNFGCALWIVLAFLWGTSDLVPVHAFVVTPSSQNSLFGRQPIPPTTTNCMRIKPLHYSLLPLGNKESSVDGKSAVSKSSLSPSTIPLSSVSSKIPFVIQPLADQPPQRIYQEISRMCIQAFFNDGPSNRLIPFWKELQLRYLRALQQSDLKIRRQRNPKSNVMFVARRVYPADPQSVKGAPLVLDNSEIYNLPSPSSDDYVRGEVLGFVEVTLRPYGLGKANGLEYDDDEEEDNDENGLVSSNAVSNEAPRLRTMPQTFRPILTNLSVQYEARQSGVGSRLMELCEQAVVQQFNKREVILEVEDDNFQGLRFYEKRGYKVIFEDPTSRRYDTSGLFLRQVRCNRKIMRKVVGRTIVTPANPNVTPKNDGIQQAWARFRDSLFSMQR